MVYIYIHRYMAHHITLYELHSLCLPQLTQMNMGPTGGSHRKKRVKVIIFNPNILLLIFIFPWRRSFRSLCQMCAISFRDLNI